MLSLDLSVEYDNESTAKAIFDSVLPDNEGYASTELVGKRITIHIEADNAGTLRNTADDLMACIKAAEEASGLVSGPASDLNGDTFLE